MGFRNGAYATIWRVDVREFSTRARISISRKTKEGTYEQDFSGYVTFYGTAKPAAAKLKERDRIRLDSVDVTNHYDKEKQQEYVYYKVFEFSRPDDSPQPSNQPSTPIQPVARKPALVDDPVEGESIDEEGDLPF